jgi:hypothetical protein
MALGRRVLASNRQNQRVLPGLQACGYANGEAAIQAITCPVLFCLENTTR